MAEKSQNADSGKEKKIKKKKEKTIQQQKGLPTLSADLNEIRIEKNTISGHSPPRSFVALLFIALTIELYYSAFFSIRGTDKSVLNSSNVLACPANGEEYRII